METLAEEGWAVFPGVVDRKSCAKLKELLVRELDGVVRQEEPHEILPDDLSKALQSIETIVVGFLNEMLPFDVSPIEGEQMLYGRVKSSIRKQKGFTKKHRDLDFFMDDRGFSRKEADTFATYWVALHDLEVDVSRLILVPGSHVSKRSAIRFCKDEFTAPGRLLKRGDVIIFRSGIVHQGTEHKGSECRVSMDGRIRLTPID